MKRMILGAAALACFGLLTLAADAPAGQAKTFKTDPEGFILNWLVLEPVRLTAVQHTEAGIKALLTRDTFKPVLAALPKDGDTITIDGETCQWHAVSSPEYTADLARFATGLGKPNVNVLFFGVAYITASEEMKDARLAIGSDDDSFWWVNGKEAIGGYGVRQVSTDDNVSKRLTLGKGVNIVRFAVIQGDGPTGCCARFYDARQKAITNLSISLVLPPAAATAPAK